MSPAPAHPSPSQPPPPAHVYVLGVSGLSSSGKTTLSRLLRRVFANTTILHQDDFYVPDGAIPVRDGLADWDCVESIDFAGMRAALEHVRAHGELPRGLESIEDGNAVGKPVVGEDVVAALVARVRGEGGRGGAHDQRARKRLVIVDGFLLFHRNSEVEDCCDGKILLRAPYEKAKARREARNGYVTIEGFWEDPPGYFDKIVWPNYVREHKYMFENEDVDGPLKPDVLEQRRIRAPEPDSPMERTLEWAVEFLLDELGRSEGASSEPTEGGRSE